MSGWLRSAAFLGAYTKAVTHGHLICAADLPETFVEQSVDLREYITISFFTA